MTDSVPIFEFLLPQQTNIYFTLSSFRRRRTTHYHLQSRLAYLRSPTMTSKALLAVVVVLAYFCPPSCSLVPKPTSTPATSSSPSSSSSSSKVISSMPTSSSSSSSCRIENFRQAAGIGNVYRCASTDVLGEELNINSDDVMESSDRFVLEQVGLILDLRSPSERKEALAQRWMQQATTPTAPIQVVETDQDYPDVSSFSNNNNNNHRRFVVRINVLSPPRFMEYIEAHWLSPSELAQAVWFKIVSGQKLHELRIEKLNERGLAGLNEAILETGQVELFRALKTITLHLETHPSDPVVIHCVQGKDRTGMLVMLLQSMLGLRDEEIVADYYLSNEMLKLKKDDNSASASAAGSAAAEKMIRGRLSRKLFSGTNPEAMITTLDFLRGKYGSVSPGYLDSIGFDSPWRQRLLQVLVLKNNNSSPPIPMTRSKL